MFQAQHSYLGWLLKYDQPTVALTVFWEGVLCVSEHMHVCVGGVPHTLLFSSESWEEGMSGSQLSLAVRVMEAERRGGSLFAFANILPSVPRGQQSVCVCLYLGVGNRVTQWCSPLPSTALASHAYLTLQMQSCLLSCSEARCLNLSLCPIPQWVGTMGCNGSTRGLLNALEQQGRNGWGYGGCGVC